MENEKIIQHINIFYDATILVLTKIKMTMNGIILLIVLTK